MVPRLFQSGQEAKLAYGFIYLFIYFFKCRLGTFKYYVRFLKGGGVGINHLRHKLSMAKFLTTGRGGVQIHQNHAYVILEWPLIAVIREKIKQFFFRKKIFFLIRNFPQITNLKSVFLYLVRLLRQRRKYGKKTWLSNKTH